MPRKPSAGARIRDTRSLVWVTYDAADKKKIRLAAAELGIPMSQFVAEAGLMRAESISQKKGE